MSAATFRQPRFPPLVGFWLLTLVLVLPAGAGDYRHGSWNARHSDQPSATEYWDLSARMASGHFVFARFFITNEGPGIHTAAGIGTLVHPDGQITPFRYGRRQGDWTLSADRLMIDIASLTLDMRGQPRHFELDSDKRGIKIHLNFPSKGTAVWSEEAEGGHHFDVLELAAPISGTIWVQAMAEPVTTSGIVTITHAWMDSSESDLVARQVEIVIASPELAVYATDFSGPAKQSWRWLAVRRGDEIPTPSAVAPVSYGDPIGERRDYPLPGLVRMANDEVTVEARPTRELLRLDPIEVVPQPFRFLLSLKMKPQRITTDAVCQLRLAHGGTNGQPLELKQPCLLSVTYLNPVR